LLPLPARRTRPGQASEPGSEGGVTHGGAGGFFSSRGGGTKPFSPVLCTGTLLSDDGTVAASAELMILLAMEFFMFGAGGALEGRWCPNLKPSQAITHGCPAFCESEQQPTEDDRHATY